MAKKNSGQSGFTIVELLIVVVIIAILAAITVVAYNGIQGRAKNAAAQATANTFAKKVHTYYSVAGSYPSTTTTVKTTLGNYIESTLGTANIAIGTPTSSTGTNTVKVELCGTAAGVKVTAFDYLTNAVSTNPINIGDVSGTCTAATA